ncbi:6-phosphogluconate dehydrogenase [Hirsutella rhossiliensis]|uniref:6-phosphogluconate dehydrogenase n=1 Tax=Hirsutella rhossiliensis TaxID=111463 RepID=A0A9P8MZK1_9HYPO|nr:6-phosphogluconate dehydrogenase [Hirsutella rhossiliensis]KAH0963146.1 6-phosphogluconate dehydrogenase [Hirsutella rhossiliensis]
MAWRPLGVLSLCRRPGPKPTPQSRWLSSSRDGSEQTRFSYFSPAQKQSDDAQLFAVLGDSDEVLANPLAHNAAVVLATPHYARQVGDSAFVGKIARLLAGDAHVGQFHVLCAVVDHLAPAFGGSETLQGISVLRGHLDDTLPELWLPQPPKSKEDSESVSSLTFDLGSPWITLPLARTTFQNGRPSTLITSRFDMTRTSPQLAQSLEKHFQRIRMSLETPAQSVADLGLWAPLSPVTRPRFVTESFGNIIRGVRLNGKSEPASTELEAAVETMFRHRPASGTPPGPVGVWAMVTPSGHEALEHAPDPTPILQGKPLTRDAIEETAECLEQLHQSGGRFYQILSGGGGWGSKKGLLSLDPERTHMVHSEEEAMARFVQTMEGSGFAAPGSQIQFFTTARASPRDTAFSLSGTMFGVPDGVDEVADMAEVSESGCLVKDHFGALSSKGVFVAGSADKGADAMDESKLSVPGSRIYVDTFDMKAGGLGALGAAALAEAVTAALIP